MKTQSRPLALSELPPDELLTPKQVAQVLHVSQGWVFGHASGRYKPVLPSIKMGKTLRFSVADLQKFIDHCRRCIAQGIAIN